MVNKPACHRVLLKITGEALGSGATPLDMTEKIPFIIEEIVSVHKLWPELQLAIVVGGGNFIRGKDLKPFFHEPSTPDYMGMICTALNALTLQDQLEKYDIPTRVMSSIDINKICEPYIKRKAMDHLKKGRIVIFACGTGSTNLTTDTAAIIRALEIGAKIVFKATKVDGIYSADPKKSPEATLFEQISHRDVMQKELEILDSAAVGLARDNKMNIRVFHLFKKGNLQKALEEKIGSLIC